MLTGPEGLAQPALQQRTLRLYGELVCRRESWAGKLVYAGFAGAASTGLAAASSLAGAASLVVDGDANGMKAQFRDGAFDFLINTLDEALRAIKNEIRQGRPIAIGLMAEPESVRAEAVERGLAAELVLHAGRRCGGAAGGWGCGGGAGRSAGAVCAARGRGCRPEDGARGRRAGRTLWSR